VGYVLGATVDGAAVGPALGAVDGAAVGPPLGASVDGAAVGYVLGGTVDGAAVGPTLGATVDGTPSKRKVAMLNHEFDPVLVTTRRNVE